VFEIWTNPSTGAEWRVGGDASSGPAAVVVSPGRTYDPTDPTDWLLRHRIGAPVLQEWLIEAFETGAAHVVLDYGPPWEKETVYRQLLIDVVVRPFE
jgi:predicted secreted protein